jgi:hypothetical protein
LYEEPKTALAPNHSPARDGSDLLTLYRFAYDEKIGFFLEIHNDVIDDFAILLSKPNKSREDTSEDPSKPRHYRIITRSAHKVPTGKVLQKQ